MRVPKNNPKPSHLSKLAEPSSAYFHHQLKPLNLSVSFASSLPRHKGHFYNGDTSLPLNNGFIYFSSSLLSISNQISSTERHFSLSNIEQKIKNKAACYCNKKRSAALQECEGLWEVVEQSLRKMCMKEAAVNREAVSLAGQRKPSKRHISGQTHHLGGSSLSKRCFKPAFWLDPSRADRCSSVNALRSVFFA
ncbi:hypothetical protein T4B_13687 [Trichinella pseudospiralis]|uniref:Uncharacterized protein n=1 Tax=Trichinella pseudospiralis TaxID=6337 RepID=A0A0V1IL08_TRIPS|nr:hypothetical protein T4B_13687 [Trichinella pseudospiralis]